MANLAPYLITNIKEYNASRPEPLKFITSEQHKKYSDQVDSTEGFDVDGCSGFMPGKIVPVSRSRVGEWDIAEKCAEYAAAVFRYKGLKCRDISKLNIQAVGGVMYYITFTGVRRRRWTATYQAKVWVKPGRDVVAVLCRRTTEEVEDGDDLNAMRRAEEQKKSAREKKAEKSSLTRAFFAFVRSIQGKNPEMTFTQARKEGSRRWSEFNEHEKSNYIAETERHSRKRSLRKR